MGAAWVCNSAEHVKESFRHLILEREEEQETGERIVQLKELDMRFTNLSEVDDQLLARAVVKIKNCGPAVHPSDNSPG